MATPSPILRRRLRPRHALPCVLLCIALLWILWNWKSSRALQTQIAGMRSAGHVISLSELRAPSLPPEQDRAEVFRQATAALSATVESPSISSGIWDETPPYPAWWHRDALASTQANRHALDLARKARELSHTGWWYDPRLPRPRDLSKARRLALQLADSALLAHFQGNDAEAIEYLQDALALSDPLGQSPDLVCQLVTFGIDAVGCHGLQRLATQLQIADARFPATEPVTKFASRATVSQLIQHLMDDGPFRRCLQQVMYAEQAASLGCLDREFSGKRVLRPLARLSVAQRMNWWSHAAIAIEQPDFQSAKLLLPPPNELIPKYAGKLSSTLFLEGFHDSDLSVLRKWYEDILARRLAAISLAIALYRNDNGTFPQRLEDLVPAYLPTVPTDPFSPTGQAVGYILARNDKRPVLHSAGPNGIDEFKDESFLSATGVFGVCRTSQYPSTACDDYVSDVTAWRDPDATIYSVDPASR